MSMASRISARAARLGLEKAVLLVTCAYGAVLVASAKPAPIPINLRLVMLVVILGTVFSRPCKQSGATTVVRENDRRRTEWISNIETRSSHPCRWRTDVRPCRNRHRRPAH